jgi:geranylgeranyl diphosphate synthase type II
MDVSIPEYLQMIAFKTSVLLACSLQVGAVVGGASEADQAAIYDFGVKLGMSFQIKDDWLDTFGESGKVGKKAGGDIIQNKKTFLLITLLKDISAENRSVLISLMNEKDEEKKVAAVKALYTKYQISEKTSAKVDTLYKEALASLDSLSIPTDHKKNLLAMAEMVHKREF